MTYISTGEKHHQHKTNKTFKKMKMGEYLQYSDTEKEFRLIYIMPEAYNETTPLSKIEFFAKMFFASECKYLNRAAPCM